MAKVASVLNPAAIIALGDNVYPAGVWSKYGLREKWRKVWFQGALRRPWYAVLGNHDWRGSGRAQRDFTQADSHWNMPDFWHSKRWANVEVFFIDSQIWRGSVMSMLLRRRQQETWLKRKLAESDAVWKIVAGHHPIWSAGWHGGSGTMKRKVDPLLRQFGASIYLAGHNHCQEYITHEGMHYIVSGAGSKVSRDRADDL